jgi:formamidopyrimidine-DNA glycosylase
MPELPDLIYIEKKLDAILAGKRVTKVLVTEPIVFRIVISKGIEEALRDTRFEKVFRHGPLLGYKTNGNVELVLHPMLAGRLQLISNSEKPGRGLCCSFHLDDGYALHYLDEKRMGKLYLIPSGEYEKIPRYLQQGLNILSPEFTLEKFRELIKSGRQQVRVFLMDQTALSAIGNAYADEILFDAKLHPKTFCYQLNPEDVERLYESILNVVRWGIAEVEKAQKAIEVKVRDHLKVRNRKNRSCPRCGTTIRAAGVRGYDAFFCPQCQPATRKHFIEWK